MGRNKELTPKFESEEKEAEHWDTHSPLDHGAEPEAQKVRVRGAKDRPITIRLDSETRQKLNKLAAQQGIGPSTLARSILISAIDQRGILPSRSINSDELRDLLDTNLPKAVKEQAENLTKAISIGTSDNPAFLLYEPQINELGELGLQAISILLAMYGVQVITQEHTKYKKVKTLVQSGTSKGGSKK